MAKKSRKDCNKDETLPTVIPKFLQCVAKDWNILVVSKHGYILTAADCHTCLIQVSKEVKLTLCDSDKKSVCMACKILPCHRLLPDLLELQVTEARK